MRRLSTRSPYFQTIILVSGHRAAYFSRLSQSTQFLLSVPIFISSLIFISIFPRVFSPQSCPFLCTTPQNAYASPPFSQQFIKSLVCVANSFKPRSLFLLNLSRLIAIMTFRRLLAQSVALCISPTNFLNYYCSFTYEILRRMLMSLVRAAWNAIVTEEYMNPSQQTGHGQSILKNSQQPENQVIGGISFCFDYFFANIALNAGIQKCIIYFKDS